MTAFVLQPLFASAIYKYDRDYLCVNKSEFVPVIFEPPCTLGVCMNEFYTMAPSYCSFFTRKNVYEGGS